MRFPNCPPLKSIRGVAFVIALTLLAPIWLYEAVHFFSLVEWRQSQQLQSSLEMALIAAKAVEDWVDHVLRREMAIQSFAVAEELRSAEPTNELLRLMVEQDVFVRAYALADPRGRIIASSLAEMVGTSVADRLYFRDIAEGREWIVSDVLEGKLLGGPTYVVARAIRHDESLQGAVFAFIDPQGFGALLDSGRLTSRSWVIIDQQGKVVYSSLGDGTAGEALVWISGQPLVLRALSGEGGVGVFVERDGRDILSGAAPVRSIGWAVVAGREKSTLIGETLKDLLPEVVVLALLSSVGFVAAIIVAHRMGGSVSALRQRVAASEVGGLQPLEAVQSSAEVGVGNGALEPVGSLSKAVLDLERKLLDILPMPTKCTDAAGQCDYFNQSWLLFTGRTLAQEAGDGWLEAVHPDDLGSYLQTFYEAFKVRRPFEVEYRLLRHDGQYRWVVERSIAFYEGGVFAGYISSCLDITERIQQEERLAYLAAHDPLTGLPNRRSLEEALTRAVAKARRGLQSTLLFLDVDNFKRVNDSFGHARGDRALIDIALLLQRHLRVEDLLVRLGGDEFAVLLEGAGLEEARLVAERMRQAVERFGVSVDGIDCGLSVSIGLVAVDGSEDAAAALSLADAAMYRAKEMGRNQIVLDQRTLDRHQSA